MTPVKVHPSSFAGLLAPADVELVVGYVNYLRNGWRPVTEDTVRTYLGEVRNFLRLQRSEGGVPLVALVNRSGLTMAITSIPKERVSSRRNLFYAVKSLAAFLRDRGLIDELQLREISEVKFRSRAQPSRPFLTPERTEEVIRAILADDTYDELERLTNLAVYSTLVLTGLRNSELCQLCLEDVDFDAGTITVRRGKGGKRRIIGLPGRLVPMLQLYLGNRPTGNEPFFFLGPKGNPLNRDLIVKRFQRLSKKLGFSVRAHMCRRSFATHRAHDGVPLDKLQVVMGHADIATTRMYVQTREEPVAQEMRSW